MHMLLKHIWRGLFGHIIPVQHFWPFPPQSPPPLLLLLLPPPLLLLLPDVMHA